MDEKITDVQNGFACPLPIMDYKNVLMAHGGGGTLTHQLIKNMFASRFGNELLEPLHDGAMFSVGGIRFAFSTDSYVVNPIFFPGGDIGKLAVNGTVNDLAMCGAHPLYLSSAFIIEEGLSMEDLWRIVRSMEAAAAAAGVQLVTGDTKVVDRGSGDKIFINTSGIGIIPDGVEIDPRHAQPGDKIILSGTIADHGIAIMSVREGLEFETQIESDCAPLNGLVETMFAASKEIHVLRDPTRGGVASVLNEIVESAPIEIGRAHV
jgi:hydrogenase expression/formation protein HypE